jgi:hypothetical protein
MQPVNLIAAALITQVSLVIIVAVAGYSLHVYDTNHTTSAGYRWSGLAWRIFGATFLALALLMSSDEFGGLWGPLFGVSTRFLLPWSWAILLAFVVTILLVAYLVAITGGARQSPFSPLFFILPALALFLRQPGSHVLLYFLLICGGFSFNMKVNSPLGIPTRARSIEQRELEDMPDFPFWWVAIASFALATFVGYITRPL